MGKMDGFQNQRPNDYDTLLDDAKSMHIILHDTTEKRAFQTNAEDLILHILLHRRILNPTNVNKGSSWATKEVEELQFASADWRKILTRNVMINNCEKTMSYRRQFSSSKLKAVQFKDEVKSIFDTIDGLWANSYADSTKSLKVNFDFGQVVSGWEYMQIVESSRTINPKSTTLGKSCGQWNRYAKDIQAVVLFGASFGDVLQPASPNNLCLGFKLLPKDKSYLGLRVDTLEQLFDHQGSSKDQRKLTGSGLTLQDPKNLFKPCDQSRMTCSSNHTMCIISQTALGKDYSPIPLQNNGAIIIGGAKTGFFTSLLHREHEVDLMKKDEQLLEPWLSKTQVLYDANQEIVTMAKKAALGNSSPPLEVRTTADFAYKVNSMKITQAPNFCHTSSFNDSLTESSVVSKHFSSISSRNNPSTIESVSSHSLNQQVRPQSIADMPSASSPRNQYKALDRSQEEKEDLLSQDSPNVLHRSREMKTLPEPIKMMGENPPFHWQYDLLSKTQQDSGERRLRRKPNFFTV